MNGERAYIDGLWFQILMFFLYLCPQIARVAELADAPDLGSGTSVCGFDSHPSQKF